jgi:hypothetical protein
MLVAIAFLAGCAVGWMRAARRGGNLADRLQYAVAHGVPAALAVIVVYVVGLKVGWWG